MLTCSIGSNGTKFDGEGVSCLLEVEKGVVVSTGAIKIPATTQHFSIRQVHPDILLEVTHLTPPATRM